MRPDTTLLAAAGVHVVVALGWLAWSFNDARPVLPAAFVLAKPVKFGVSIALFLASMAFVVSSLSVGASARSAIVWVLVTTMAVEQLCITVQSARGVQSHFNTEPGWGATVWSIMMLAIVAATIAMAVVTVVACAGALVGADGAPIDGISSFAWRAALSLFLLAAVSGFAMGGRLSHSVGSSDATRQVPLVGWHLGHGDLRISHFVSLHGLQLLPLVAWLTIELGLPSGARWFTVGTVTSALATVGVTTLRRAMMGRSAW